ncbi:hypothetical protein [Massilia cavernae]|nr:hypothetical protein [Massilia cavernae]
MMNTSLKYGALLASILAVYELTESQGTMAEPRSRPEGAPQHAGGHPRPSGAVDFTTMFARAAR